MKNLINTFRARLFLLAIILVFTTGCSQTKSLLGPGDGDIDMDDAMAEHESNLEHEANMADDGDVGGDIDMDDAEAEHEANLEHERNMEEDGDGSIDIDDAMNDIDAELEYEQNMEDGGDSDMEDAIDEHEANLEHEANMADDGGIDYNDLDDELILEEERSGGSCNMIAETSICTDYIGSFWTEAIIRNACSYSGTFSSENCETGSIGGCNVGQGSFSDMIIWMYPYGGSPVPSDTAESAKPSCDINPMGTWVDGL